MGSRSAPVIDHHHKPHENYSNEPSDLNANLIPAGEPAYLTIPLGVKSTERDVQRVYRHAQSTMLSLETDIHLMLGGLYWKCTVCAMLDDKVTI